MLIVDGGESPAGRLVAIDDRAESAEQETVARSTRTGSVPAEAGESIWRLVWVAPESIDNPIRFDLWGNAGNDDQSPFGDTLHHRVWQLPADPEIAATAR